MFPDVFFNEDYLRDGLGAIKVAHSLAHKNVPNSQLKQRMQWMQVHFSVDIDPNLCSIHRGKA